MPDILYVYWNEREAGERVAGLIDAGHDLRIHWSEQQPPRLGDTLPNAVVISLDRLPSHGRAVADWFWEARRRRHVPDLFEGGKLEKAAVTRQHFPDAHFFETGQAAIALEQAFASSEDPAR